MLSRAMRVCCVRPQMKLRRSVFSIRRKRSSKASNSRAFVKGIDSGIDDVAGGGVAWAWKRAFESL